MSGAQNQAGRRFPWTVWSAVMALLLLGLTVVALTATPIASAAADTGGSSSDGGGTGDGDGTGDGGSDGEGTGDGDGSSDGSGGAYEGCDPCGSDPSRPDPETVYRTVTSIETVHDVETVIETESVHHTEWLTETTTATSTVPTTLTESTTVDHDVPTTVTEPQIIDRTVESTVTKPGPTSFFAQYLTQTQTRTETALSVSTAYDRVEVTWALASTVNPATGRIPAVSVTPTQAAPGDSVQVSIAGFTPGEPVQIWLHSTPVLLGTVTAGSDGTARSSVTIPVSTEAGQHTINVVGVTCGIEASIPITIVAAPAAAPQASLAGYDIDGRSLSYTGVDTGLAVSLGAALLGGGVGLVLLGRRRLARAGGVHAVWRESDLPPSGRHRA